VKIGQRNIGHDINGRAHPVMVIAELGVNHDGSVERALELVAAAKRAGADAVKMQVFRAGHLMHAAADFAEYQSQRVADATPIDMLTRYELDDASLRIIADAIIDAGMEPIATAFSLSDVERVAAVASCIKIASPDLVNRLLLSRAISTDLPLMLSTGACDAQEIEQTCDYLKLCRAKFVLLHCVSSYPVASESAQLCWIARLAQHRVPIGYSDHTTERIAGALAVASGACVVEKHLTYDTAASGPDHAASADEAGFMEYIRLIRLAETMRGDNRPRDVLACEADVRRVSRQSLVAVRNIAIKEDITETCLTTQRPGTGLSALLAEQVIGRKAARPIARGTMLTSADIEGDDIEGLNA
jgi:N,N'-diacetyllegionaminate synthase